METRRYTTLLKVIELGSFSKAADALGYTQSAVSQAISSLEAELGVRIVNRSRHQCRLTLEGEELMPFVNSVANAQLRLEEKAQQINGLETGIIRIGTVNSISQHWLPKLMTEFNASYPHIGFVVHSGDYGSISEWIHTGVVDFGFVSPKAVDGMETRLIGEGAMHAVLPEGHPLAARDEVPLAELAREPFILLEEGGYYEPLEAFVSAGIEPNIRYTIHDDHTIMGMVAEGLGVSIMATLMTDGADAAIQTRPTTPAISRLIALGYRDEASIPVAAKRFMDLIEKRAVDLS